LALTSLRATSQTKRPKILGIGRVMIMADSAGDKKPYKFYSELNLPVVGSFCTGAPCTIMYALNEQQELILTVAPRPPQKPEDPPHNNLASVMFRTSNVNAMHDYLQSKGLTVGAVALDTTRATDAVGADITGNPSFFMMKDPDGHGIGFIQFDTPLKPQGQGAETSTRLIHVGFIVRDRAAEDHFYRDILGFHVYWHGGMKDDQTDWVDMEVPDGTDWIEYMLNVWPDADHHTLGVMNHIALGVPDIHVAQNHLLAGGMMLTEEPHIGRGGKWQLNLYDPDGTRVELMEFTPVQKPCCSEYTGPHPKP
jgi:catechol 2,3-dioxygenase-like lactoylglutathione lyase family enzyme